MLKKLLSVLIVFIIVFSGQSFVMVSAASDVGRVYADYSFDKASGIEFHEKTNSITYETDTSRNTQYIKLSKTTSDDCYIQTSLPSKASKLVIEADINLFSGTTGFMPFYVRNSGSESPKSFSFISVTKDGKIVNGADSKELTTVAKSSWNRISVSADFAACKYDLWINGKKVASGNAFSYDSNRAMSSLRVYCPGTSGSIEFGIDNLRIYESSLPLSDNDFANIWYMLDRKTIYDTDTTLPAYSERPSRTKIEADFRNSGSWGVHPRLMIKPEDVTRIKNYYAAGDEFVTRGMTNILYFANKYGSEPVLEYKLSTEDKLLDVARDLLNRSECLGMAYLITDNEYYAERLYQNLLAVAAFPDWNHHTHYLDTGEMSAAYAMGYDYIYNYLDDERRAPLIKAMKDFAIYPGRSSHYASGLTYANNWNSVVNGGIAMAALAIADEDEDFAPYAFDTVEKCIRGVEYMMPQFAPDGAWEESSGYWNLAMRYCMRFFSSLESACGTNYGLTNAEGFKQSGYFTAHVNGPVGLYNYHDSSLTTPDWDMFMWFSKSFGNYDYATLRKFNIDFYGVRPNTYDLMFYSPDYVSEDAVDRLELDKHFRNVELVTFRSTWKNKRGMYLAAHGGYGKTAHWNLDSGTFVIDSQGVRFAEDLGAGNYAWDGFVNNKSYLYYVKRTEGQNCVIINPTENQTDMGQDWYATSPVTEFVSDDSGSYAVMNLTDAYNYDKDSSSSPVAEDTEVSNNERTFYLTENRSVITIKDDITLTKSDNDIYWFMHTKADINVLDDYKVLLTRNGKQLLCEFTVEGADSYTLESVAAEPLPTSPHPEVQEGVSYGKKIQLKAKGSGNIVITARFTDYLQSGKERVYYSDHAKITPESDEIQVLDNKNMYQIINTERTFPFGNNDAIYVKFDLRDIKLDVEKAVMHFNYHAQNRNFGLYAFRVENDNWEHETLKWSNAYDATKEKVSVVGDDGSVYNNLIAPGLYGPDAENYVTFSASANSTGGAGSGPLDVDITELVKEEMKGDGVLTLAIMVHTASHYDRPMSIQFSSGGGPYIDITTKLPDHIITNDAMEFTVDGAKTETLKSGVLGARYDVKTSTKLPGSGTMILAVYDGDKLIDISFDTKEFNDITVNDGVTSFSANTSEKITVNSKTKVSVLFWMNKESLSPLVKNKVLTADGIR